MHDPTNRYLFYRGEVLLGKIVEVEVDQPLHVGRIEPGDQFPTVAPLFDELASIAQASESAEERQRTKERTKQLRDEISKPGLRLIGERTGRLRFEPILFNFDGNKFWWRGHVWDGDKKLV